MWVLSALSAIALLQEPGPTPPVIPPPAQEPPAVTVEDVTVEGQRLADFVREFVVETAAPARGRGLARWHRPICAGVVNLDPRLAQPIVDRISQVGLELGLRIGEPGCRANVFVVFTEDSGALTRQLVEEHRRAFHVGTGGIDRGQAALAVFTTTDLPVRWWHTSMPVNAATGNRAIRLPGGSAPQIKVFAASRLTTQIRDDLLRSMVIVDIDRLEDVNLAQLADYVALVSLAQIDPEADVRPYDTILNLFDDPQGVGGLTDWDWSYLNALYATQDAPVLRRNHAAQTEIVAGVMARDRRRAEAARLAGTE